MLLLILFSDLRLDSHIDNIATLMKSLDIYEMLHMRMKI